MDMFYFQAFPIAEIGMPPSCGKTQEAEDISSSPIRKTKNPILPYAAHILLQHSLLVKSTDSGAELPGFKSQLYVSFII